MVAAHIPEITPCDHAAETPVALDHQHAIDTPVAPSFRQSVIGDGRREKAALPRPTEQESDIRNVRCPSRTTCMPFRPPADPSEREVDNVKRAGGANRNPG